MKFGKIWRKVLLGLIVFVAVIWSLFPVFYLWLISFAGLGALPTSLSLPKRLTLDNWRTIFLHKPIWPFMWNSLVVAAIAIVITLAIALPAAYSFSRHRTRLNNAVFTSLLFFRMIPYISIVIPIFFMLNRYHLLGTRLGLSLAHLVYTVPLSVWLMKSFFDMLTPEIEESALIDGASRFGVFWRIALPLSKPGIAVTVLFAFLLSYIEFLFALIITRRPTFTLPVRLGAYMTIHETYWRLIACSSLITLVPMVLIFALLQRHLVRGFTLGAIK